MVGFKFAIRLFVGLLGMTPVGAGRVPAGVNRKLLGKSGAAGMKLIGNPAKLVSANFCRLCDLRSREVCLYRAPKDFAGLTAVEPGGHPADGHVAVNLSESTLMGQTMSNAIFLCLTTVIA